MVSNLKYRSRGQVYRQRSDYGILYTGQSFIGQPKRIFLIDLTDNKTSHTPQTLSHFLPKMFYKDKINMLQN